MIINTLRHNYCVIHKLTEEKELETYLCKEINEISSTRYRVIRLKSKELTYKLISFFMEQLNNSAFEDYYDCFSKDGDLYVVFLNSEYPLLMDKLGDDDCSLRERLEIGKGLLERIILLNIPAIILYDALAEANVTVSDALEVRFNYNLENLARSDNIRLTDIQERFLVLFSNLFAHELALEASADIKEFVQDLSAMEYKTYFEIYHKYEQLYEKLNNADALQSVKPNTRAFRLWEKLKSLGKLVKPIFILTILCLIIWYLIYSVIHKPVDSVAVSNFHQIGSITVEESDE